MFKIISFSFLIISLLLSCRVIKTIPDTYAKPQERTRLVLAIFMDGTMNKPSAKENKNTHVKVIYDLADTNNIGHLYVEGVGAGFRLGQAIYAGTTKERTMRAYRFLAENYKKDDSICLFGFSRGANQCRILASLIYTIGIINLAPIQTEEEKEQLLHGLYDQYEAVISLSDKRSMMAEFLYNKGLRSSDYDTSGATMIELMGLWDTVEAFSIKDKEERTTPSDCHLNQLYNVKKLFHAVSLDDNRAYIYTPILATQADVAFPSYSDRASIVEEVWFNGSHKDAGGGVGSKRRDRLSDISLKWMLSRLEPYHIFSGTGYKFNTYGKANKGRNNPLFGILFKNIIRSIDKYQASMYTPRIKVHQSVIDRLQTGVVQKFKLKANRKSDWYDWEPFKQCFDTVPGNERIRMFRKDCPCIEVVNDCLPTK